MTEKTDRLSEKRELLSSVWLFHGLPAAQIDQLSRYTRTETYRPNETIMQKGELGSSMMIVVEGHVKICSAFWDGREVVFNIMDRGDVFGEIALLDGKERTADAIAMGPTVLFVLERRDVLSLIHRTPENGVRLLSVLCDRIRHTSEQVEDMLFLDHRTRLAKVLLWLAKRYGHDDRDRVTIEMALTQRELGTLVGVRREAMNRQLATWRDDGLIELNDRMITILDLPAFTAMVDNLDE